MPLYAGICETDITPPLGVWMCGYAFRPTGCVAIHDPLYARAIVLDNGQESVAILAMDLLGLDFDVVDRVRSGISGETGLKPESILLNATHTHGGPNVREFTAMGSRDPAYIDMLVRKLVSIAKQARNQMTPASFAYGTAPVQIGVNRRQVTSNTGKSVIGMNPAGPVDPVVAAVVVQDSRGLPRALLFCHACHPTTLGGENLEITADFPGYACAEIRRQNPGVMPFFLQGCAGNINPHPRGAFEHAQSHGLTLADAAQEAMESADPLDSEHLSYREVSVALPLIPPPPVQICRKRLSELAQNVEKEKQGGHKGRVLHAEGLLAFAEHEMKIASSDQPVLNRPFAIQALNIGGTRLIGMPGEMFVQYQLDFKRQCTSPVVPLAYTNGVHGYVPTAADYPLGGYEVDAAYKYYGTLMYAPESEGLIRETAYDLLGVSSPNQAPYAV